MKPTSFLLPLILLTAPVAIASAGAAAAPTAGAGTKAKTQQVYQLDYMEREPGVEDYEVVMLVSDRYIRIDQPGEDSGYIVYDDRARTIYSVSHFDKSTLVIKPFDFSEKNSPAKASVEYLQLADAPQVAGHSIYNYRVFSGEGENEETCSEIQLVENILPEVRSMLKNYQQVVSGQQVKMADNKITEMQNACFFIDQIYNTGAYYDKGMPIQEWHSNDRFRLLTSYKKVQVSPDRFKVPQHYRQFSIDRNSKMAID